jgi:hypothetical protein
MVGKSLFRCLCSRLFSCGFVRLVIRSFGCALRWVLCGGCRMMNIGSITTTTQIQFLIFTVVPLAIWSVHVRLEVTLEPILEAEVTLHYESWVVLSISIWCHCISLELLHCIHIRTVLRTDSYIHHTTTSTKLVTPTWFKSDSEVIVKVMKVTNRTPAKVSRVAVRRCRARSMICICGSSIYPGWHHRGKGEILLRPLTVGPPLHQGSSGHRYFSASAEPMH